MMHHIKSYKCWFTYGRQAKALTHHHAPTHTTHAPSQTSTHAWHVTPKMLAQVLVYPWQDRPGLCGGRAQGCEAEGGGPDARGVYICGCLYLCVCMYGGMGVCVYDIHCMSVCERGRGRFVHACIFVCVSMCAYACVCECVCVSACLHTCKHS